MSRRKFAKAVGISLSYLTYIENGNRNARPYLINRLADVLRVSWEERNRLLQLAGHQPVPKTSIRQADREIRNILTSTEFRPDELEELVLELKGHIHHWRKQREARKKAVQKAVVVIAGWQPRLLSSQQIKKSISHVFEEIQRASIQSVAFIVAPDSQFPALNEKTVEHTLIVQREPLGLGHAVSVARNFVREEPFALLLPDDIDPTRLATKKMKGAYPYVQRPIVALNPPSMSVSELRYYGIAQVRDSSAARHRLLLVEDLHEKPRQFNVLDQGARSIAGRYILTPDIFDLLLSTKSNVVTGRIELTDALRKLRQQQDVFAYELPQRLVPLAPLRSLIEKVIDSIDEPTRLKRIVELTDKMLNDVERV